MSETPKDLAQLALATANRLRQVQADFADHTPEARQEYLSDEVERVISSLVPNQREGFLDALRDHFPTWDANMAAAPAAGSGGQAAASQSPTDQREWNDVSFVLERVIELAKPLDTQQKHRLAGRLAEAGISLPGNLAVPPKIIDELKTALKIDGSHQVDPARLIEMAVGLAMFANSLDQLVWQIWKNIAPKSTLRSSGLQNTLRRFTQGDSDVSLSNDLEQLRHLTAALLSAISQIGTQFGQQHLARFAPHEIESMVVLEKGSIFVSKEVKCWQKYKELAKSFDDTAMIDSQVRQIIAGFVEAMKGLGR